MAASETQVGGSHYKDFEIQPAEFIHRNKIGFLEGNVIKYVCRHAAKNGRQDLEKARHYIGLLIEYQYALAMEDVALMDEMNGLKTYGNAVDD